MNQVEKIFFRNQFRKARYKALKDAGDFESIFHAIEGLGAFLTNNADHNSLNDYLPVLKNLIDDSVLAKELPKEFPSFHNSFLFLYETVRRFRNQVAHQGVYARNKTRYAIELGLIFEQVLNNMDQNITNYMVRNPTTASLWEPLSHVRKVMLINSFSYIPIFYDQNWVLISDYHLHSFLKDYGEKQEAGLRLNVKYAFQNGLEPEKPAQIVNENYEVRDLELTSTKPVLVLSNTFEKQLVGLVTSFDLL
jgi:CBS domain-containing protein